MSTNSLDNLIERFLRWRDESGKEPIIRCAYAKLHLHPKIYECEGLGVCTSQCTFGSQVICGKELYRNVPRKHIEASNVFVEDYRI